LDIEEPMRSSLCREFLIHLDRDGHLEVGPAPKAVAKWLDKAKLPWDLAHLLRFDWPQKGGEIHGRGLYLAASKDILAHDLRKDLHRHGFLPIGSAPNGDLLVVRCDSEPCEVGFITHEEYWEHKDEPVVAYQRVARTLDSLLFRVAEGRYIPIDYYAAKEFNAFLAEEDGKPG
jgi:hypothetical protein